ncbi:hypothetical protein K8R43_00500 [archaeon]|nr:hypothetical protein [archaeon]
MVKKILIDWYKKQLASGLSHEQLLEIMKNGGYTQKEINMLLTALHYKKSVVHSPPIIDDMAHVESIKHWERKPTEPPPKPPHLAKKGIHREMSIKHPSDHFKKPRSTSKQKKVNYKEIGKRHPKKTQLNELLIKEFNVLWAMVLIGIVFILLILGTVILLVLLGPGIL